MRTIKYLLTAVACATAMFLVSSSAQAQGGGGRGNWDPAQMREMMLENLKTQMAVTNDDEWKVIEPAITNVMSAQREVQNSQMNGFRNLMRNRNRGGDNNNGENANRQRRGGMGEPSPELTDLQKAIEDNAPADEVKDKLGKLRAANAAAEAKLTAAQEDLKKLLSARQEAVAVVNGLLK